MSVQKKTQIRRILKSDSCVKTAADSEYDKGNPSCNIWGNVFLTIFPPKKKKEKDGKQIMEAERVRRKKKRRRRKSTFPLTPLSHGNEKKRNSPPLASLIFDTSIIQGFVEDALFPL